MGCDVQCRGYFHLPHVSIHAPTWGATYRCDAKVPSAHRFNPRTHMGCDQANGKRAACRNCFNPRTHMGCDTTSRLGAYFCCVSIHAPTWGATLHQDLELTSAEFQSTHPHGVRHIILLLSKRSQTCFNPRTHMGCDFDEPHSVINQFLFQSTHPHGVRH